MVQEITIRNLPKPREISIIKDISWISNSLGLTEGRDTEKITEKIILTAIEEIARRGITNSQRISENLNISIQRTNYHLRSLIQTGLLTREKRRIEIRQGSVKAAIEEIRKDANRILDEVSAIAEEIDERLGLIRR